MCKMSSENCVPSELGSCCRMSMNGNVGHPRFRSASGDQLCARPFPKRPNGSVSDDPIAPPERKRECAGASDCLDLQRNSRWPLLGIILRICNDFPLTSSNFTRYLSNFRRWCPVASGLKFYPTPQWTQLTCRKDRRLITRSIRGKSFGTAARMVYVSADIRRSTVASLRLC